jgi:hypothetical protein
MKSKAGILLVLAMAMTWAASLLAQAADRPNILLVMADDQGWGQTGYNNHPILKTPHPGAMAEGGLRFDRFYAAGPVCPPTRASVLTGRTLIAVASPTLAQDTGQAKRAKPAKKPEIYDASVPKPTLSAIPYGKHERHILDF